ncbi:MAG: hypothetical protein KJ630_14210 [Proteobacteria bacterium]|nr:hypothetical protein [Pseudomonadota bacterium]
MDDRVEMTYKIVVRKEHRGIGMTRKMARDALSDLVALGAITASRSGNGVLVSAISYCNHLGPTKGPLRAQSRAQSRANLVSAEIHDIFGDIDDDIISEGHVEGHVEGPHIDTSRAHLGGVLYRGDKREKIKKNTSSSTASIDAADSQEDSNPPWLTLVNHWNEQLPTYRKVLVEFLRKNEKRKKSINAIIKTVGMETLFEIIKIIPTSKFLSGESECDFKAYFDWIIKIDNIQKILEGKFTDTKEAPKKIEFTTFVKDFKPCADAATKIRESYNNEKG